MAAGRSQRAFKVRLHDFSCDGVAFEDRCDLCLQIDFGGFKRFRTDGEASAPALQWRFRTGFEYLLGETEKLGSQALQVRLDRLGHEAPTTLAEGVLDLETVACGPSQIQLTLRDPEQGTPRGLVRFTCVMKMRSPDLTISLANLQMKMRGAPAAASLQVGCTLQPDAGGGQVMLQLPHSQEGHWRGPCNLCVGATLGDLVRAPEHEGLQFLAIDETGMCQGESTLAFRHTITARSGDELPFRLPLFQAGTAAGEISGVLRYQNLPYYAQMVGGCCIDGYVEGAYMLLDGLPYPQSMSQPPPLWCEAAAEELASEEMQASEWNDEDSAEGLSSRALAEALEQIELPQPWEQRKERGDCRHSIGSIPSGAWIANPAGRVFFADPRSRRTTWKDPRFLPPHWEQRIDPQSGRVYFQYHKTRQTTYVDPRGCPLGWEMRLSKIGDIYFAHVPAQQTTFVDPRGLPEGVETSLDAQGRMYFKDHEAKTTGWDDPRDGPADDVLARWRLEELSRWWSAEVWRFIEERTGQDVDIDDPTAHHMDLSG